MLDCRPESVGHKEEEEKEEVVQGGGNSKPFCRHPQCCQVQFTLMKHMYFAFETPLQVYSDTILWHLVYHKNV